MYIQLVLIFALSPVITDFQLNRKGLTQSAAISYSTCRSLAML